MRAEEAQGPRQQEGEAPLTDRFLMAARALRGEFDPEATDDDTEENSQLLGAIIETYPAPFSFTAVGRSGGNDEGVRSLVDALTKVDVRVAVTALATAAQLVADVVATSPRIGGKFASVRLTTDVQSRRDDPAARLPRSCAPSASWAGVKMAARRDDTVVRNALASGARSWRCLGAEQSGGTSGKHPRASAGRDRSRRK